MKKVGEKWKSSFRHNADTARGTSCPLKKFLEAKQKGLALSIGVILVTDQAACFGPGDHGSTFGGNALCSAVAAAVFKHIVEEDLPGNAARVGTYFRDRLLDLQEKYEAVKPVADRGRVAAYIVGINSGELSSGGSPSLRSSTLRVKTIPRRRSQS